jgi:hypothetical protein
VSVNDCRKIDAIAFQNGDNSICEAFGGANEYNNKLYAMIDVDNDLVTIFYLTSISLVGLYIFYQMLHKK